MKMNKIKKYDFKIRVNSYDTLGVEIINVCTKLQNNS